MIRTLLILIVFFAVGCKEAEKPKDPKINLPNYDKLALLDVPLPEPKDGDWLKQHKEPGQTFEQYLAQKPVTVSGEKNTIYLQPIGIFNPQEQKVMQWNAEYIRVFFGLKTVVLDPIYEDAIPKEKKRIQFDTEQLDASYIIHDVLPNLMPGDGIVIMALTAKDLYPNPEWNYVFGLASYKKRTAVTSLFRFSDGNLNGDDYALCLSRFIKTSTHEIGHMFSMAHCIHASCLMNGGNHMVELDSSPNALCSVCFAKLSWNLQFNTKQRLETLISFCKRHKLDKDAVILQKQLEAIISS